MEGDQPAPTQTPNTPIYQESQEKNAKWLWLLIALIIIGALVFAFFRGIGPFAQFRQQDEKEFTFEESPSTFISPTPQAESSPAADLDKSEPQIRVLNGSGRAGIASSVKDFLEGLGYKVASIGNANSYDYEQTEVRFKESFKKFQETLVSELSNEYSVKVSDDDLEATDSADIEIVIGVK